MDAVTLQMIVTAVIIVATNAVTLKWLKSDMAKHGETTENHRLNIRELYKANNDMMTSQQIAQLVKQVNEPMKNDIAETKVTLVKVSDNMTKMSESMARMDERQKIRDEDNGHG